MRRPRVGTGTMRWMSRAARTVRIARRTSACRGLMAAMFALLTSAAVCQPHAPHSPPAMEGRFVSAVGVSVKDGQLEVLAEPCGPQEVVSVVVFDSTADSVSTKKEQVIWAVRLPLQVTTASRSASP